MYFNFQRCYYIILQKENHARHMNNLRDRYLDMKRAKNVEETKEVTTETKKSTEDPPSFGTRSSFCDKKRERRGDRRLVS